MRLAAHPFLLAFAIGVAVVIAYAALDVGLRVSRVATRRNRPLWVLLASVTIAGGLWSMHWLCMRSADITPHPTYDWRIGLGGWFLSVLLCGLALRSVPLNETTPRQRLWLALLAGLSMAVAHYAAIFAMRLTPAPEFNPAGVLASLLWPMLASGAALETIRRSQDSSWLHNRLVPALLIGAGFVGMHLLALHAAQLAPGTRCAVGNLLGDAWMGVPAVFGLSTLLAASLALTVVDNHELAERERSERDREHAERVRRLAYYDRFTDLPNRTMFNATLIKRLAGEGAERPAPFGLVHIELDQAQQALQAGAEPFVAWLRSEVVPHFAAQYGEGVPAFRYALGSFMLLVPAATRLDLVSAAAQLKAALPRVLSSSGAPANWSVNTAHFPTQGLTAPALVLAGLQNKNTGAGPAGTGEIGSAKLTLA